MCVIDVAEFADGKGVKIVHINARSLINKLYDISHHFCFCDVVIITETWLNCSIPTSAINIEGFTVIRQDRYENINKKGGGICIYVNSGYTYDTLPSMSSSTPNYETRGIKIKVKNIKPFFLI